MLKIKAMQLKIFEEQKRTSNISELIRSEFTHELGVIIAESENYSPLEMLIDSLYCKLKSINLMDIMPSYCFELFKTESINANITLYDDVFHFLIYKGDVKKVHMEIYELNFNDNEIDVDDFFLAKKAEKEIRKNQIYISLLLKNKI